MHQATWDEAEITALDRLQAHVEPRLSGRVRQLRVDAHAEGIILQGYAFSYYVKQLAQHAVMEACDAPILANEIEVL